VAQRELEIGRIYMTRGNFTAAINRFKIAVKYYPSSLVIDEALFLLVQSYLTLGICNEAQTAAAVLNRKFPNSHWRTDAIDMLKAKGLDPAENEKSWISAAFQ
jgi:outer membrane protein assembly factor BamD